MARPTRHRAEMEILDLAAGLFARHGFAHTSLKDLADAVGLSKAGLLHHYPSKEALFEAAQEACQAQGRRVLDQVAELPPGPARDRRALELLTDVALDLPGLVSLAFGAVTSPEEPVIAIEDVMVFEVFAVAPDGSDVERAIRVVGALAALAVLSVTANRAGEKTAWRPHIITTCLDALGHRRPGTPSPDPDPALAKD
ncbi:MULTISPECIES: TetR/AcrR family transcriptional regulator [Saccharothrix]|uniref:TetR family transcriptional regulator n=1 Tax=Saccharothrix yanglingensis TaxID=659496 RepID=A0ABU0WYQ8_9PSEU|nr:MULTISPECIES: helix-turn-helix domain-containing protein [Saccharothrix]MDQ2585001.1 TetR family transcriptional regulator [Saccharothrix yanglingensis]MDU0288396.1 helix-turn-helix domain-containing protein [Saccharothrix longispora]